MGKRQIGHRDTGGRGQYVNAGKGTRGVGSGVRKFAPLPVHRRPVSRFPPLPVRKRGPADKCRACKGWGFPWRVSTRGVIRQVRCRSCRGTGKRRPR